MNPTFNALPADAKMCDLLQQLKEDIFRTLNCHVHVTVDSFDPTKQTITATVNYLKTIFVSSVPGQLPTPTSSTYTPLVNCPVFFQPGFTSPIVKGMQALVAFNDRDMDNYLAQAVVSQSNTSRKHSFSDAFAFVGMGVPSKALSNFDMLRVAMQYQGAKVGVSSAGVLIQSDGIKLSTALTSLVSAINTFMETIVANGISEPTTPITWAALAVLATAASTSLTAAQAQLGEVLE